LRRLERTADERDGSKSTCRRGHVEIRGRGALSPSRSQTRRGARRACHARPHAPETPLAGARGRDRRRAMARCAPRGPRSPRFSSVFPSERSFVSLNALFVAPPNSRRRGRAGV
jgi:hypothetical protein